LPTLKPGWCRHDLGGVRPCHCVPAGCPADLEGDMGIKKLIRKVLSPAAARLKAPKPGTPAPPRTSPDDYLRVMHGPYVRMTTVRVLDPASTAKGVLSSHDHLEGDTPDGPRQIDVYAAGSCSCGCLFDKETRPTGVCGCGKVVCADCARQCTFCHAVCCSDCRVEYTVGDKELTYCPRCRWRHYWRLWWGTY